MARVVRINVTPVKGLALAHPTEVELNASGARDDRRFLVVDTDGRLVNGKRIGGGLGLASADWDVQEDRLTLTLPGGDRVEGAVERGREVSVEVYGRQLACRVVEGAFAAALEPVAGFPVLLAERPEEAWATDARPATLVSRASLDAFGGDGRRFRMLLEVDGLEAYEEDRWCGRRLQVGEVELVAEAPTPRCALPSFDPSTGERDTDMLREILDRRGAVGGLPCLGIYAAVTRPGVVCVGDAVEERS